MSISYIEASDRLDYDPETGDIVWRTHKNPAKVGQKVFTGRTSGYLSASIKFIGENSTPKVRVLLAQRVAWLLAYKSYPEGKARVSHIDGNRENNKLSNLRAATFEDNRAPSFKLLLTQKRATEVFDYNPTTGELRWKIGLNARGPRGSIAGTEHNQGYRQVKVDGLQYLVHRVIWLIIYGSFPVETKCIDHINGIRDDNRISNLREVTYMENSHNTVVPKGFRKIGKKYIARITIEYNEVLLGEYTNAEEASKAYLDAKEQYFPGLVER